MKLLYQQNALPIFQNRMYDSRAAALACPEGDVRLVEDEHTGLVYNAAFRPELMQYDAHYQNEQAYSPLFHRHLEEVAHIVERGLGRQDLVEVGCGKAYFLEMLLRRGLDVTGFDPTYEGDNPRVQKQYFAPGAGLRARGLVLRHVLEHVPDPYQFLVQLRAANFGSGMIYIEVPCLDWICRSRAWFDIFYEHVNYFRLGDFSRLFARVTASGRLFGGQYLYVVADLAALRAPLADAGDPLRFPADMTADVQRGGAGAIWGGASKGVIFALLKQRAGHPIATVIDINPAKQGKFLPGSGLLVESPSAALARLPRGTTIYVMNPNYLEEIRAMSGHAFDCVAVGQRQ